MARLRISNVPKTKRCSREHPYNVPCPICFKFIEVLYDPESTSGDKESSSYRSQLKGASPFPAICVFCGKEFRGKIEIHSHRKECSSSSGRRKLKQLPNYWFCYRCYYWLSNSWSERMHRKECPKVFVPPDHSI